MDWTLMASFFICLVAGFLIIIPAPYSVGVFWLVVSCVTYMPVVYLPCYCQEINNIECDVEEGPVSTIASVDLSHMRAKRSKLAVVLTIILPLFTVNYILAAAGAIDYAATIVIYQVLSVATKGLFASVTMDIHFDLLVAARMAVSEENDRHANEARRAFLKYIFHELRSPLNSLTIGIEILSNSSHLDSHDLESLGMMKDASSFMNDTLNDVLSMQKIEEGLNHFTYFGCKAFVLISNDQMCEYKMKILVTIFLTKSIIFSAV